MKSHSKRPASAEALETRQLLSAGDILLGGAPIADAPATVASIIPSDPPSRNDPSSISDAQGVWSDYAGGPQHQALSTVASLPLNGIRWQTTVDLDPQYSGGDELLIHYGTPLITAANTIIVPVKTGATDGFELEALNGADGSFLWSQASDYTLPPHGWTPSYSPALAGTRVYFAGAGGTVYYRDSVDSATASSSGQIAFYGIDNYNADSAAYASSIHICTPLTADANGNVYFGFQADGSNPLGITDGFARIGSDGSVTYTSAAAASGVAGLAHTLTNVAPAVSLDGQHIYVAVSNGLGFGHGNLVELDSSTLTPQASVALNDPQTGMPAILADDGTASPMVGPDGDVYFGVLENPIPHNHQRGWMLHFSSDLSQEKTPGAFGWDDTPSVVPASMVPSYHGSSSYLLMTKYNNYVEAGGNGINKIAILDPNGMMTDPITGETVMTEVLTIAGPTHDSDFPNNLSAVREWCINTAVVDPATDSILANNEDGTLYRWDLATNSFSEKIALTSGFGEAYTPTLIGADGKVYAINDATLFAVGNQPADLSVSLTDNAGGTPSGSTTTGGLASVNSPVVYTLIVTNTSSTVAVNGASVVDSLPANFFAPGSVSYTATATGGATGFTGGSGSVAGNITDNALDLPALSSVTYHITGTVASSATNFIIDSATVNVPAGYQDPNTDNNTGTDTIALPAGVKVNVTGPASVIPGNPIQFTIVVTNDGTAGVTGVGIANSSIAADFSSVKFTAIGTGGAAGFTTSGSSSTINDTVNLPAGSSITYSINGTVASSATGTLTDSATATTPNGVPNLDHSAGFTNTNAASASVPLTPTADVYVAIAGSDPLSVGATDIYTILITNNGPSIVPGGAGALTLHDAFSSLTNITYSSAVLYGTTSGITQGVTPTSSLTLNDLLSMSAGAIVQYTIIGTVAAGAPATLSNTVTATVPNGIDPVLSNNTASVSATVSGTSTGSVAGRYVFYFNSGYDGGNIPPLTVPTTADFAAIAPDKVPLLPGQSATYNNYTDFTNGLNGIFIDLFGDTPASITAADFEFITGNTATPGTGSAAGSGWTTLATAPTVTAFPGKGINGSDRIALTWPSGTIAGKWLQVTVKGDTHTGLNSADPDVFYFGNAIGESGNSTGDALVNANDDLNARADLHSVLNPASISDPHDYNRDSLVNAADELTARGNNTSFFSELDLFTAPGLPNQNIVMSEGASRDQIAGGSFSSLTASAQKFSATPAAGWVIAPPVSRSVAMKNNGTARITAVLPNPHGKPLPSILFQPATDKTQPSLDNLDSIARDLLM